MYSTVVAKIIIGGLVVGQGVSAYAGPTIEITMEEYAELKALAKRDGKSFLTYLVVIVFSFPIIAAFIL